MVLSAVEVEAVAATYPSVSVSPPEIKAVPSGVVRAVLFIVSSTFVLKGAVKRLRLGS